MTDYTTSDAYRRGRARAAADRLAAPPDDGTIDVSVPVDAYGTRDDFKLCRSCGEVPGTGRCCGDEVFTLIRVTFSGYAPREYPV